MVKAAADRMRNNVSEPLDQACVGGVLAERNVTSHSIVIGGIFRKNSLKVPCVDHDQMISALAPDRADQSFNISVLPGCPQRRGPVYGEFVIKLRLASGTVRRNGAANRSDQELHEQVAVCRIVLLACCL